MKQIEVGEYSFYSILVICMAIVLSVVVVNGASCTKANNDRDVQMKIAAIEKGATVTFSGEIIGK